MKLFIKGNKLQVMDAMLAHGLVVMNDTDMHQVIRYNAIMVHVDCPIDVAQKWFNEDVQLLEDYDHPAGTLLWYDS